MTNLDRTFTFTAEEYNCMLACLEHIGGYHPGQIEGVQPLYAKLKHTPCDYQIDTRTHPDLNKARHMGEMVLCALRYALQRHSYMPDLVAEFLLTHWKHHAIQRQRCNILSDLLEHLQETEPKDKLEQIDYNTWQMLYKRLLEMR